MQKYWRKKKFYDWQKKLYWNGRVENVEDFSIRFVCEPYDMVVSFHFQYRLVMLYIVENPTDIRKSIETIGCVQLIHNVIKTILTLLLLLRKVCVCFEKRRTSSFSSWWQTFERNSFEYNSSWDHHNLWTMSRWVENP